MTAKKKAARIVLHAPGFTPKQRAALERSMASIMAGVLAPWDEHDRKQAQTKQTGVLLCGRVGCWEPRLPSGPKVGVMHLCKKHYRGKRRA